MDKKERSDAVMHYIRLPYTYILNRPQALYTLSLEL